VFLRAWRPALVRRPTRFAVVEPDDTPMRRIAGPLLAFALALANASANAQAGATPATHTSENAAPSTAGELNEPSAQPPTAMSGGERPSGRVLCPRDLAGKSLRCADC